jgi:branched-chain amino acid transport system permease protein
VFEYLLVSGITTGALYALVALGVVVLYRAAGVVNFSHGEQIMAGGFFAYSLHLLAGFGYVPAALLAVAGTIAVGVLTFYVGFLPLARQGLMSILLATLGLSYVLKGVARYFWGGAGEFLAFPSAFAPTPIDIGPVTVMPQQLLVVASVVVILLAFSLFFNLTRVGKWMQAAAENPKAARLCGVPVERVFLWTFAVGAALSGAAAVLMAPLTLLYPDMGFLLFLKGFAAAVLGGLTSLRGAVLGGLLMGVMEQLAAGYIHTGLQELSAFLVIMVMLVLLPRGLLGGAEARRV